MSMMHRSRMWTAESHASSLRMANWRLGCVGEMKAAAPRAGVPSGLTCAV